MQISHDNKIKLSRLLREIRHAQAGKNWEVPLRSALEAVDCTLEELMCHGYAGSPFSPRSKFHRDPNSAQEFGHQILNPQNFCFFLNFLEAQGLTSSRYFFRKVGYFFPTTQKKDILLFFREETIAQIKLSIVQAETESEGGKPQTLKFDEKLLASLIQSSADFQQAICFYGRVSISLEKQISLVTKKYLRKKEIRRHYFSLAYVSDYLQECLWDPKEDMPGPPWDEILIEGLSPYVQARYAQQNKQKHTQANSIAIGEALQTLGYPPNQIPELREVKIKFHQLIKQWHPDVHLGEKKPKNQKNQKNIDQTQRIIGAYRILEHYLKDSNASTASNP